VLQVQLISGLTGGAVLCAEGEIDAHAAGQLARAIAEVPAGQRLTIDLAEVAFMDSAGLGALLGAAREFRSRGSDIVIARPRPALARLLHATGIDQILKVVDNLDVTADAVRSATIGLEGGGDVRLGADLRENPSNEL
jgi:anti-sigma B factor antagonist